MNYIHSLPAAPSARLGLGALFGDRERNRRIVRAMPDRLVYLNSPN